MKRSLTTVLSGVLLVASCSSPPGAPDSSVSARLEGPLLVSAGDWAGGMDAQVGGRLSRVGRCVGVDATMVVWPEGVGWDEDAEALVLADGSMIRLGEDVVGGGGSMSTSAFTTLFGTDAADALAGCRVEEGAEVTVFNVGSEVGTRLLP